MHKTVDMAKIKNTYTYKKCINLTLQTTKRRSRVQ